MSLRRIAHHEAGHAVACVEFTIPMDEVTVIRGDGSLGHVVHYFGHPLPGIEEDRERVEYKAMIALAGAANEARALGHGRDVNWSNESYQNDIDYASELLATYSTHEDEDTSYFKWIAERTKSLVNLPQFRSGADALAEVLMERKTLSGKEAAALVRGVWNEAFPTRASDMYLFSTDETNIEVIGG